MGTSIQFFHASSECLQQRREMDHTGLMNGPSPYADTAEAAPLGIEYQGGNHFVHAQNVSRSGLDQLAAQLDMMSFTEQNRQQLAVMQQQQQQQQHLIQQHEHNLAQQQMSEYQQQLRRTDPVYASMTSHNVSTSSNPSPPPLDQRQTPPPDTSHFQLDKQGFITWQTPAGPIRISLKEMGF